MRAMESSDYPTGEALDDLGGDDSGVALAEVKGRRAVRTKEQTHRRRRGDTIRASDFPPLSVSFDKRTLSRSNSPEPKPKAQPATRRTRSGTITLANMDVHSRPIEVLVTDAIRMLPPKTRGRGRKLYPRTVNGEAAIIMKIDDEPLPPQGSDEEDDELLLTGEMWKDHFSDDTQTCKYSINCSAGRLFTNCSQEVC